jgi:hypothetical protein
MVTFTNYKNILKLLCGVSYLRIITITSIEKHVDLIYRRLLTIMPGLNGQILCDYCPFFYSNTQYSIKKQFFILTTVLHIVNYKT